MHQLVQITGALLVLSGFVLAQFGVLDPRSLWYLVVNVVGSAVLTVDAYREAQWGFLLLELAWATVSAVGLVRLAASARREPVSGVSPEQIARREAGVRLQSDTSEQIGRREVSD